MNFYLARDRNGSLFLYKGKPKRNNSYWYIDSIDIDGTTDFINLSSNLFPDIKWEDKEPTKVELTINNKI